MHLKGYQINLAAWLETHFIYWVMAVKIKTPTQNHLLDQIIEKRISCCAVWYTPKTVMVIIQIPKMSMTIVLRSLTTKEQLWIFASTQSHLCLNTAVTLICVNTCFRYICIATNIKNKPSQSLSENPQNVSVGNTNLTQYSIPNMPEILWNGDCLMKTVPKYHIPWFRGNTFHIVFSYILLPWSVLHCPPQTIRDKISSVCSKI